MADIELVVKISEDSYKATCRGSMLPSDVENIVQGIKNGTLLPKGHGRIVDIDMLEFRNVTVLYDYDWECGENTYAEEKVICADDIRNVTAIIEADKEQE